MPTVHEEAGFAVRIYTHDHPPPHVHVVKLGGVARVQLSDSTGNVRLMSFRDLSDRDVRRAVRIVERMCVQLYGEWLRIHGTGG